MKKILKTSFDFCGYVGVMTVLYFIWCITPA